MKTRAAAACLTAIFSVLPAVQANAKTLIHENFPSENESVWRTIGPQAWNGRLELKSATTGELAGILSVNEFDGTDQPCTLTVTTSPRSGSHPIAFVGFSDNRNWGGKGKAPAIVFRCDQAGATWYLNISDGNEVNVMKDSEVAVRPDQKLQIVWGVDEVQMKIAEPGQDTYAHVFSFKFDVPGPQHVLIGGQAAPENFVVDDLLLESNEPVGSKTGK